MKQERRVTAPAKLNLGLQVLGRRDDGYHELDTEFHAIDLSDVISVSLDPGSNESSPIFVSAAGLPGGDTLITNAVERFAEAISTPLTATIHVTKRIPVGAGLGGGSSDAGTVLRTLNAMLGHPLKHGELMAIAAEIGSDVPFFVAGVRAARGRGRGEVLSEPAMSQVAPEMVRRWLLVVPELHCNTASVFAAYATQEAHRGASRRATQNDLFAATCSVYPEYEAWVAALNAGGVPVVMSGSGSALACELDPVSPDQANIPDDRLVHRARTICSDEGIPLQLVQVVSEATWLPAQHEE